MLIAVIFLTLIALALLGFVLYAVYSAGRTAKIHDTDAYRDGRAEGIRVGTAIGADEREELADRLDETTAEYVRMLDQITGIARERDEYKKAVDETNVIVGRMGAVLTHRGVDVDAEDDLERRTGHRDLELVGDDTLAVFSPEVTR